MNLIELMIYIFMLIVSPLMVLVFTGSYLFAGVLFLVFASSIGIMLKSRA